MTSNAMQGCEYCGLSVTHSGVCPRVKSIEYHANGTVKRVEFHDPNAVHFHPAPIVIREQPYAPLFQPAVPHEPIPFTQPPSYPVQPWATCDSGGYVEPSVTFAMPASASTL